MKKRLIKALSIILTVMMLVGVMPLGAITTFAADAEAREITGVDGYYTYRVLEDGTAEITNYRGNEENLTIPTELGGYKVTRIGNGAFGNLSSQSIIISDSVTYIGELAFVSCYYLTNIVIPDSVTYIDDQAFNGCRSLTNVIIPDSVAYIGEYAFSYCYSLTNIAIPYGITTINKSVFMDCRNLTDVIIPNSVTSINEWAFNGCRSLTNVIIPDSVTYIGNGAFGGCESLTNITIPYGITAINKSVFSDCENLTDVKIPNSVTSINEWAFSHCRNLKNIVIPESVTFIGYEAFYYCDSLKSIEIPNSVTVIESSAFRDCNSLTRATIGNGVKSIDYETFFCCKNLTEVIIGSGLEQCNFTSAFSGCDSLKNVNISKDNTVFSSDDGIVFNKDKTEIIFYPSGADRSCYIIPDSVTSIGDYAFGWCFNLKNIIIPNSVTSIKHGAFNCCIELTSVTIGSGITSIGDSAFNLHNSLKDVYYAGSEDDWNKIQIGSYNENLLNADIHYNCSTGSDNIIASGYCGSTTKWKLYDNGTLAIDGEGIVKHYSKTYSAPWSKYASQIKKVIVGEGVTRIGEFAFYNCTNLTSAEFADSVEKISGYAFKNCSSLTDIKLPANLKNIGDSAFYGTALKEITMPESVEIIGHYAFSRCYSLKNIKFTGNAPTILSNSFSKVTATVKIPSDNATWTNRVKLDYGGKLKWLEAGIVDNGYCGSEAVWKLSETGILTISPIAGFGFVKNYNSASSTPWYKYASDIKTIIIEDGITRIGSFAFYGLKNLSKIQFADTVKEINNYAFKKCSSLTEIKFPANIEKIGESAFYGTGVEQIVFPESIKEIHSYAFANCEDLHEIEFTAIDPPKFGTNVFKNVVATIDIPVLTAKSWQQIIFQQKTILGEYLTFI